ncbi:MAG: TraR/DksA C4-type zinc finger protein [Candidatus Cloacimonadaceae bacterium]
MADIADLAQIRELDFLQDSLSAVHSYADCELVSLTYCEICGEPIPEARRIAIPGVQTCVNCQERFE